MHLGLIYEPPGVHNDLVLDGVGATLVVCSARDKPVMKCLFLTGAKSTEVIAKLDEVRNDVKKNTDSITNQVDKIGQVQATARKNTEEIQKLRQELENQKNNPSLQLIKL